MSLLGQDKNRTGARQGQDKDRMMGQDRGETRAGQGQDDGTGQGWDRTWSSTTVKNMG